jgi:hypothetical protein
VNITTLHEQHLRRIVIGIDKEEIHPENAYKIITERSKIIVENRINDGKFIKGICQKYSSGKPKRKSIYELVNRAIKNEIIEFDNCGGVGGIIKVTQDWIDTPRYKNIFKYKLMAIFDSDRKSFNELTPHENEIKYFKRKPNGIIQASDCEHEPTDLIIWHILYKRQIENYIPLDVLFINITSITPPQKNNLNTKTQDELDFIEYDVNNIGIGQSKIKEQLPNIFLSNFSYHKLEKKCEHHKVFLSETEEWVSEIEQILLKIAKII